MRICNDTSRWYHARKLLISLSCDHSGSTKRVLRALSSDRPIFGLLWSELFMFLDAETGKMLKEGPLLWSLVVAITPTYSGDTTEL